MSEIMRVDDYGPQGFRWLTLKRITVRVICMLDVHFLLISIAKLVMQC